MARENGLSRFNFRALWGVGVFHVKHRRGDFLQVFLLRVVSFNILSKSMSPFAWFVLNILNNNFAILPQSLLNLLSEYCPLFM